MNPADPLPDVITGLSRQNSIYRRMIAVCDQVADAAVKGADAQQLTQVFAKTIDKLVILLNPSFELRACAGNEAPITESLPWNPDDAAVSRLLRALAEERRPLRIPAVPDSVLAHGCLATPITVGDASLGYLLVLDQSTAPESDDVDLLIASYAATLFALTLANERTSTDLGLRYQGAIVDALVSGHFLDHADARRKAISLGLADRQAYRVGVLRTNVRDDSPARSHLATLDLIEQLLIRLSDAVPSVVAVARGTELVMLLPEPEPTDTQPHPAALALTTGARVLRQQSIDAEPTCGMSERIRRPEHAPIGLRQAEHAIDLGIRIGRTGQVISYDELGIYRLLLQIGDMQQLWRFAEDVLGSLLEYDATHKLDLIGTLSVYLNQHESLKQTARALRLHVNTISYRIQRIEQLTPLNLTDPDDRLIAHVAVKIIESQRAGKAD
jgi:purine catabolism regulator